MAVESARGCGFRKAGGIYLVTGVGIGEPCERLPIPIDKCPVCQHAPVAKTRGPQFVGAQFIFGMALPCAKGDQAPNADDHHGRCPLCNENLLVQEGDPKDKFMLMWIGKEHYKTPHDWTAESNRMGVSRRVATIPKGLVLGKTWVLVAHPEAIVKTEKVQEPGDLHETARTRKSPGIFHAFRPQFFEVIVTAAMKKEKWVKDLQKKHEGIKLVEVPEDDPDHAPTVSKKSKRKAAMDRLGRKHAKKAKKEGGR